MTEQDVPQLVEFHTWLGKDGRLHGSHKKTRRKIEGKTARELQLAAMAVRIPESWGRRCRGRA